MLHPLAHRVSVRTREKKERNRTRSYEALTSNGLYKPVDFYDTIKRPKNDIFGIIKRLKSDIFGTEEAYKSLMETQRSADINTKLHCIFSAEFNHNPKQIYEELA